MSLLDTIKNKAAEIKENFDDVNHFKKDARCKKIMALKGDRKIENAIIDKNEKKIYFYKDVKYINVNDWLIDERNEKYFVKQINDSSTFQINYDSQSKEIKVVEIIFDTVLDTNSLVETITSNINNNQNIQINIQNISNSSLADFGKNFSDITNTLSVPDLWKKIEHDLDYRFDYKKYQKVRENVNEVIDKKNADLFNKTDYEKIASSIGSFIGAMLAEFVSKLISYCSK